MDVLTSSWSVSMGRRSCLTNSLIPGIRKRTHIDKIATTSGMLPIRDIISSTRIKEEIRRTTQMRKGTARPKEPETPKEDLVTIAVPKIITEANTTEKIGTRKTATTIPKMLRTSFGNSSHHGITRREVPASPTLPLYVRN